MVMVVLPVICCCLCLTPRTFSCLRPLHATTKTHTTNTQQGETWESAKSAAGKPEFKAKGRPGVVMTPADLAIRDDPQLNAIARAFASDNAKFLQVFSRAYVKLMNADRFDGPAGNVCDGKASAAPAAAAAAPAAAPAAAVKAPASKPAAPAPAAKAKPAATWARPSAAKAAPAGAGGGAAAAVAQPPPHAAPPADRRSAWGTFSSWVSGLFGPRN